MIYILFMLIGVYVGGCVFAIADQYLRNPESNLDTYAMSMFWPIGVMMIVTQGRDNCADAIGISEDYRRMKKLLADQEEFVNDAHKFAADIMEHSNLMTEQLLESADVISELVRECGHCERCGDHVMKVLVESGERIVMRTEQLKSAESAR